MANQELLHTIYYQDFFGKESYCNEVLLFSVLQDKFAKLKQAWEEVKKYHCTCKKLTQCVVKTTSTMWNKLYQPGILQSEEELPCYMKFLQHVYCATFRCAYFTTNSIIIESGTITSKLTKTQQQGCMSTVTWCESLNFHVMFCLWHLLFTSL